MLSHILYESYSSGIRHAMQGFARSFKLMLFFLKTLLSDLGRFKSKSENKLSTNGRHPSLQQQKKNTCSPPALCPKGGEIREIKPICRISPLKLKAATIYSIQKLSTGLIFRVSHLACVLNLLLRIVERGFTLSNKF